MCSNGVLLLQLKRVVRITITLLVLLATAELSTRVVLVRPMAIQEDVDLGWIYQPCATVLHTSEGRALNRVNAQGFNAKDPVIQPGMIHILVLGDSLTEALQVPAELNFTSELERIVPCLDVYNAGRSGLSPAFYPSLLARLSHGAPPDFTILVIGPGDRGDLLNGKMLIQRGGVNGQIVRLKSVPQNWIGDG